MIQRARKYLAGPELGPLLIKAVIGSAGLRIAGMFFGFLVGVQLARGLGVEGYGIYGLAMSIIALLTVPTEFGIPWLLIREVAAAQAAGNWGKLRGILHWSSRAELLISAAVTIAVILWLFATQHNLNSPLAMALVTGLVMVPLVALGNLFGAALRGLQHIVKGQLPEALIRPALHSLLLFLVPLIVAPLNPALAMGLGAVSAACVFGMTWVMLRNTMPAASRHAVPQIESKQWWASAMPMALTEGMRVLQGHLIILLLGATSTVAMVGIFRVASSVFLLVAMPVTLFNVVGAPIISRLYAQGDLARLQRLLGWIALGMTVGTLILTLPFLFAGELLLSKIFGAEFQAANTPLLVICIGGIICGTLGANVILLNMTGHEKRVTRALVISLLSLAVLAGPLIHVIGLIGGALASAISMTLWSVIMWLDVRKLLGLDTSLLSFFRKN